MGRAIDALLKRSYLKASKFKPLVNLALHRLAVLKNQRQVRCNIAKSDVVEILKMGLHDRALLRVEHVIKEQNMLDVFHMIEGYCDLVLERFHLIEQDKFCPEELKEAISSLLYAASRCGEFPELQEIRAVFTLHYGKEFAARAIELRNNCGVNVTLIQKLSTRMPSLESRMSVLQQIAEENGISLVLSESSVETAPAAAHVASPKAEDDGMGKERYFGPGKGKKYENAADAAQAAFESAAYAAHAARAAVELSRGDSHDSSSNGSSSPFHMRRKIILDQRDNARFGTQAETEEISHIEEDSSLIEEDAVVDMDTQETEEAQADPKKSVSSSKDSTDSSGSDEDEATVTDKVEPITTPNDPLINSAHEDTDDQAEVHEVKKHGTITNDTRMDLITHEASDDQVQVQVQDEAANSQGMPMPEDSVNQAHEESWIRRGWNSKIEKMKMKRPFSYRSRGVATR